MKKRLYLISLYSLSLLFIVSGCSEEVTLSNLDVDVRGGTMTWYDSSFENNFNLQNLVVDPSLKQAVKTYLRDNLKLNLLANAVSNVGINLYVSIEVDKKPPPKVLNFSLDGPNSKYPELLSYPANHVWETYEALDSLGRGNYTISSTIGSQSFTKSLAINLEDIMPPVSDIASDLNSNSINVTWFELIEAYEYLILVFDRTKNEIVHHKFRHDSSPSSMETKGWTFMRPDIEPNDYNNYTIVIIAYTWSENFPRNETPARLPSVMNASATTFELGSAQLNIAPSSLDLSSTGTAAYGEFTVTNTGKSSLTGEFSSDRLQGSTSQNYVDFYGTDSFSGIKPGESITITVRAWCIKSGTDIIPITINSNDMKNPIQTVMLTFECNN